MPDIAKDGASESQERMICPSCHHHNDPDVTFCERCGAPIGFAATMSPYQQIFAEGFALRQATTGRPRLVFVIGVWILFLPVLLAFAMFLVLDVRDMEWTVPNKLRLLGSALVCLVSAALLWCSAGNYIRKKRRSSDEPGGAPAGNS
jgi:hypothetical protein